MKKLLVLLTVLALPFFAIGCDTERDTFSDNVEEAGDEMGDAVEEIGDETEDALDDVN